MPNIESNPMSCRSENVPLAVFAAELHEPMVVAEWLAIREEEAPRIDPDTAEVTWWYAETCDPYGIGWDMQEEIWRISRDYFARAPESDIWVWFGDLPDEVRDRLWEMHKRRLAFPAGLPLLGSKECPHE